MSLKNMSVEELQQAKTRAEIEYLLQTATIEQLIELSTMLEAELTRRKDSERAAEVWQNETR